MTWVEFHELSIRKYFPTTARYAKAQEFLELQQGAMTVIEYVARFTELACFAEDYVATNAAKVSRFEIVHSGQNCRTSLTEHGLYGWDGHDHREGDRGCTKHSGCGC